MAATWLASEVLLCFRAPTARAHLVGVDISPEGIVNSPGVSGPRQRPRKPTCELSNPDGGATVDIASPKSEGADAAHVKAILADPEANPERGGRLRHIGLNHIALRRRVSSRDATFVEGAWFRLFGSLVAKMTSPTACGGRPASSAYVAVFFTASATKYRTSRTAVAGLQPHALSPQDRHLLARSTKR